MKTRHEQEEALRTDNTLLEMGVGLWAFELDEGAPPRMYGNKAMDELLGCDGLVLTPEEYYHAWYDHIHPDHYAAVKDTVTNLVAGFYAEVQYPFLHPVRGEMWVRCGGRRDASYTKGVRIVGRHQDVSDLLHLQKSNALEVAALKRLADYERDRAEKERNIGLAMELLVSEHDFTRVLNRLTALWCRALGAQWSVLGEFADGGFKVVHSFSELGDVPLFKAGEQYPYLRELSGEMCERDGQECVSIVDFQDSPAARALSGVVHDPQAIRSVASCHSHVVRFKGRRWGSIVLLFQNRHACTENELRFIAASAHGIELALCLG